MNFSCSTCLESFTSICDISTTPCGHVFHTGCITRWLTDNSNCSQCRKPCKTQQIIKLYFSESQSALEEKISLNDLEQKNLKLVELSQKCEQELLKLEIKNQNCEQKLTTMKTNVSHWSIEITQANQKCKKLEHEKLLMKRDWSKTEWNLKGLLNNANKQVKDLEKKVSEANGHIKDIEKDFNERRKEFNDQRKEFNDLKLMKLETERNLKKSINEANKRIKDLEKEVNDIKQSTKIILDLKEQPAEHGVISPCIIPCKPKYLDKTNKANKGIKDLDDQIKSGLESKAGGAVKRKCKDYPINIKDEEENIGKVITDIFDIFYATLARLRHGIKSANILYTNCKDLWEYLTILSSLPSNAKYGVHTLKLIIWLTLLQNMNINHELTDDQVREMNIDFDNATNALKLVCNSKIQSIRSKEKQHGC